MTNFILKFGKYKGQNFLDTPMSYQHWLLEQNWFKRPTALTEMEQAQKNANQCANRLKGWNGYSAKGYAAECDMFDAEVALDQAVENDMKYFGMNEETKQAQMDWEYAEICACNMVDTYNND